MTYPAVAPRPSLVPPPFLLARVPLAAPPFLLSSARPSFVPSASALPLLEPSRRFSTGAGSRALHPKARPQLPLASRVPCMPPARTLRQGRHPAPLSAGACRGWAPVLPVGGSRLLEGRPAQLCAQVLDRALVHPTAGVRGGEGQRRCGLVRRSGGGQGRRLGDWAEGGGGDGRRGLLGPARAVRREADKAISGGWCNGRQSVMRKGEGEGGGEQGRTPTRWPSWLRGCG